MLFENERETAVFLNYLSKNVQSFYYPYLFQGGRIFLDITESPMMLARALGRYEVNKHQLIQSILKPEQNFIDVGCNKGDFSLVASAIVGSRGSVLAFEPERDNCGWIRKSIDINGCRNIDLYQLALSNENGEASLYLGAKSGWHTLIPGQEYRNNDRVVSVPTRRLDDLLDEISFDKPVHMMKIDVEGADMHVLKGASRTIEENDGLTLLIDLHPELGVDVAELTDFLDDKGYSIFEEKLPLTPCGNDISGHHSIVAQR